MTRPGRPVAALPAAVALYLAASLLCEPLRADVDHPDKSRGLLSWQFACVLLAHCLLAAIAILTEASGMIVGAAGVVALALIPTVLAAIVGGAVLYAALAIRRGGQIGGSVLAGLMSTAASDPLGGLTAIVLWLAPWLLISTIAFGGSVLWLGHRPQPTTA